MSKLLKIVLILIITFSLSGCSLGAAVNTFGNNNKKYINQYLEDGELEHKKLDASLLTTAVKERFAITYDSADDGSVNRKNDVGIVLQYMKKDYDSIDISKGELIDCSKYNYLIVTMEGIDNFPQLAEIVESAKNGMGILFAIRPAPFGQVFDSIKSQIGIKSSNGFINDPSGIKVESSILVKAKGFKSTNSTFTTSAIDVQLDDQCRVHILSNNGVPFLWDKQLEKGKIVVCNDSGLGSKRNRGLLAGAISLINDNFIYPVINSKILNIDDFPAPIPDSNYAAMENMSIEEFYKTVWWPQMIELGKNYNIKYSNYFIQSYSSKVVPPFEDNSSAMTPLLKTMTQELLETSGEQGIHGYNHQPLALEGFLKYDWNYKPWKNQEDMFEAIKAAAASFNKIYPNYELTSYVAPSNVISEDGRKALIRALPKLKVISGIYIDTYYGQEFSVGEDGVANLPRVTSGFISDDESIWADYNSINIYGVYSHFVHPDDIIDPNRSKGKSWNDMRSDFEKQLQTLNTNYPWLRPMTNTEASYEIKKYSLLKPYVEYKENQVIVRSDNYADSPYFIMRSKGKLSSDGCKITQIDDQVYLIQGSSQEFIINIS
jgi:hypothetical protein